MFDWGLAAARALVFPALLLTAGLPLYLLTGGRGIVLTGRLRVCLALLALTGAGASLWWALASVVAMAAVPIGALDRETVTAVLGATPLGAVLEIRLIALAGVVLAGLLRFPTPVVALPATIALATSAWTGHAGATAGTMGALHRLADVAHLLAAAAWLGALAMLLAAALRGMGAAELERRLAGFAATGTAVVLLLIATGIANTLFIAGWPLPFGSRWALLLGIKLALFAAMVALAGLNRWRLTPALRAGGPAPRRALRRSLAAEAAAGLAVVAIVAALGLLDPAL